MDSKHKLPATKMMVAAMVWHSKQSLDLATTTRHQCCTEKVLPFVVVEASDAASNVAPA